MNPYTPHITEARINEILRSIPRHPATATRLLDRLNEYREQALAILRWRLPVEKKEELIHLARACLLMRLEFEYARWVAISDDPSVLFSADPGDDTDARDWLARCLFLDPPGETTNPPTRPEGGAL